MQAKQYFKYLESIGYLDPEMGEYGTFYRMDFEANEIEAYPILNYDELMMLNAGLIDRPITLTVAEFIQSQVDNYRLDFLHSLFHSDYSFDTDLALSKTVKEAVACNTFLTDLGSDKGSFFLSSEFEKKLKAYAKSIMRKT
jgi:hypothetical protein